MSASSAVTINRPVAEVKAILDGADPPVFDDEVQVSFADAPGGQGTELRVVEAGTGPGGAVGQKLAAVVGTDRQRQLDDSLRRLKQILETGEVLVSEGSPDGTDAKAQRSQRPAQPLDTDELKEAGR